jgi:hypothetical protein
VSKNQGQAPYAASVKAHSGPNGEKPKGTFTLEVTGDPAIGTMTVSCMAVSGDTAIVGGLGNNGRGNLLIVKDRPGSLDAITVIYAGDTAPDHQQCAEILATWGQWATNGLNYGDFKVVDA